MEFATHGHQSDQQTGVVQLPLNLHGNPLRHPASADRGSRISFLSRAQDRAPAQLRRSLFFLMLLSSCTRSRFDALNFAYRDSATIVIKEFWPDIHRKLSRKFGKGAPG